MTCDGEVIAHNNFKRKTCAENRINTSLKDLSIALNNHVWHGLLSFLSSLPISVLRYLELEANKFYDRANNLYKQHFLQGVMFNISLVLISILRSPINEILSKFPSINKGMKFIDLHSIFKDNLVISSIPNYVNNSETPIICYKYNKPIRSSIFNFNKIVTDINIVSNTPDS